MRSHIPNKGESRINRGVRYSGDQAHGRLLQDLVFNSTFYLIGYRQLREEVRIFAMDRIKMVHQSACPMGMKHHTGLRDRIT